ncbi:hypothetical protein FQN54_002579 [Arachnomyces sp. PD_36]|nr:hypothetical protein FQN54_002579 [Arachnomyces sp. PD_36]
MEANVAAPPNQGSTEAPTREEMLARMSKHIEELQKQKPGSDFKSEEKWWEPSVNFGADIQESLDQETREKFNACIAKMFAEKCSPDSIAVARSEAETILAGHPKMFEQGNAMIFQNQQSLGTLHEYATSEAAAGRDVFNSCSAVPK